MQMTQTDTAEPQVDLRTPSASRADSWHLHVFCIWKMAVAIVVLCMATERRWKKVAWLKHLMNVYEPDLWYLPGLDLDHGAGIDTTEAPPTVLERAKAVHNARAQSLLSTILARSMQPTVTGGISYCTWVDKIRPWSAADWWVISWSNLCH
jgi:hypothetical protein